MRKKKAKKCPSNPINSGGNKLQTKKTLTLLDITFLNQENNFAINIQSRESPLIKKY